MIFDPAVGSGLTLAEDPVARIAHTPEGAAIATGLVDLKPDSIPGVYPLPEEALNEGALLRITFGGFTGTQATPGHQLHIAITTSVGTVWYDLTERQGNREEPQFDESGLPNEATPRYVPADRVDASMFFDPGTLQVFLFGGRTSRDLVTGRDLMTLDVLNLRTLSWRRMYELPAERTDYRPVLRQDHGELWLFGGRYTGRKGHIRRAGTAFVFKMQDGSWEKVRFAKGHPIRRTGFSVIYDGMTDRFLFFGGVNENGKPVNDVWALNAVLKDAAERNANGGDVRGVPWEKMVKEDRDGPAYTTDMPIIYDLFGNRLLVLQPRGTPSFTVDLNAKKPSWTGDLLTAICECLAVSDCCDGCHLTKNLGAACDDGSFCTTGETCWTDGSCQGGVSRDCSGAVTEPQCQQARCDEVLDRCMADANPITVPCDDGQFCSEGDVCTPTGVCAGSPRDCSGALTDLQCQTASCNESTDTCTSASRADGTPCDDGNPATSIDQCWSGACVGSTACTCTALSACCDGCNPRNLGLSCDDFLFCTVGESCDAAGACSGGTARDCSASGIAPCSTGACDDISDACIARPVTSGLPCDDGNPITISDSCRGDGTCHGVPPCTNGQACDDGVAPHVNDVCVNGYCVNLCTCDAPGPCCDGCFPIAQSDGHHCPVTTPSDDFAICHNGLCVGFRGCTCDGVDACCGGCRPLDEPRAACDDGDPMTPVDRCIAPQGCTGFSACICSTVDACCDGCMPINDASPCDDGSPGNLADRCVDGVCRGFDDCVCNEVSVCCNGCVFRRDGLSCDDGDADTVHDTCHFGRCVGDSECICTTNDLCCDGCHGRNHGQACDDGTVGTENTTCNAGLCTATCQCTSVNTCCDGCQPRNGGAMCDDGDPATIHDHCCHGLCLGDGSCACAGPLPCCDQGQSVNDGLSCGSGLICDHGACVPDGGGPCDCTTVGPCCFDGCHASQNGAQCGVNDYCQAGQCVPNTNCDCSAPGPCCPDGCHASLPGTICNSTGMCVSGGVCSGGGGGGGTCDCSMIGPCCTNGCNASMSGTPCNGTGMCASGGVCSGGGGGTCDCSGFGPCCGDGCHSAPSGTVCGGGMTCGVGGVCAVDPSCSCTQSGPCCNGCQPYPDGTQCGPSDFCQSGSCIPSGGGGGGGTCDCSTPGPCCGDGCHSAPSGTICGGGMTCGSGGVCTVDPSCTCTQSGPCCNGCRPYPDGTQCGPSNYCAAGVCQ